jgi:hypothetical protein
MQVSINAYNPYSNTQIKAVSESKSESVAQKSAAFPFSEEAKSTQQQVISSQSLVSDAVGNALLALQEVATTTPQNHSVASIKSASAEDNEAARPAMNTDKGDITVDLDEYFSNDPVSNETRNLDELPPLLLPSAENIEAMSKHASAKFMNMLAEYNIPTPPDKITYDQQGKMHISDDYPYANELKQALKDNPGLDRELRSINAISGHYVEMQERMPFIEGMASAGSKAEVDEIIAKYSHLLSDNSNDKSIALTFSKGGALNITSDGSPIKLT